MPNSRNQNQPEISVSLDTKEIHRLHNHCLPNEDWSYKTLSVTMNNSNTETLVVRNKGVDSGFLIFRTILDEAEILSIGIAKEERRSGLAELLLQDCLTRLRNHGVKKIFLEVAEDNIEAINLYKKIGFSQNGRRKNYYKRKNGKSADAINMWMSVS